VTGERYRLDRALDRAISLDSMYDAEQARTYPLFGGGLSVDQVEKQYRMENVLGAMRPGDVSVLVDRHVEHQTLDTMASSTGVSRQAVLKRIQMAEVNFLLAFDQHWMDPIGGEGWPDRSAIETASVDELLPGSRNGSTHHDGDGSEG
jgi:hypothetical protein